VRLRSAGRRKGTVALQTLTLACFLFSGCASHPALIERRVMLMGTALDVEVEAANRPAALEASERAVEALEAAEARLSTWRDDTELARLNRTPVGQPMSLSPALARELQAARRCWEETGGAFDPGVGALVRAWGLRTGGRIPDASELRAAQGVSGLRLREGTAVREKDLLLEEGGWGKGAGLVDALDALKRNGVARASLDLGGQVAVLGGGWEVPVADPRRRDHSVMVLKVDGGSVSTSGNSEHGFEIAGKRYGHILDPRTGSPAPDFGSLTVWTADPLRADCLSTGLYVLGPERALAWAAEHSGVEVLVLRTDGDRLRALASPGLRGKLKAMDSEMEIEFGR
jgi:thiamine biosynthesis lipoprotein